MEMFITSWAISSIIYDASFKPENTSLTDIGQLQGFNMPVIHQFPVYHILYHILGVFCSNTLSNCVFALMLKIFITDTAISSIRVEGLLSRPTEPGHHCERENLKFAHSQTAEIAERHIEKIFRRILYLYLHFAHYRTAEIAENRTF